MIRYFTPLIWTVTGSHWHNVTHTIFLKHNISSKGQLLILIASIFGLYTFIPIHSLLFHVCKLQHRLHPDIPNSLVDIDGFSLVQADRDESSGEARGGGICVYIREWWCSSIQWERLCVNQIWNYSAYHWGHFIFHEILETLSAQLMFHQAGTRLKRPAAYMTVFTNN